MVKQKILKNILWVLLIILSVGAISLVVFVCVAKCPQQNLNGNEPEAYTFTSTEITDDEYNNNSTFEINSFDGYKSFVKSMRSVTLGSGSYNVKSKRTYKDKTVKLTNDIIINEKDDVGVVDTSKTYIVVMFEFDGVLDGQGYKVQYKLDEDIKTNHTNGGFCYRLNGTIKNVCFTNYKIWCDGSVGQSYHSIIGINAGTVENCVVESCRFTSNRYNSQCVVAPIVAVNNGIVKNCMVNGYYGIGGASWNLLSNPDGLTSQYFVASGNAATGCVFTATVDKAFAYDQAYTYTPTESGAEIGENNYDGAASAYSDMPSDAISKDGGETGTPWYKYSIDTRGFSGSAQLCVYPRVFIDWTTFTFTANPSDGGTVSHSVLIVPTHYANVIEGSDNILLIDNNIVTPTPTESNSFDKWTNDGTDYTANFIIQIKLSFKNTGNATIDPSSTAQVDTIYYLTNPTTINFTHENYIKTNCFKTYTITFVDSNGDEYFIKYTTTDSYYISGNTITADNNLYSMTEHCMDVTVSVEMKLYDMT